MFDFSAAIPTESLKPGMYKLYVSACKLETPANKTPYLAITFSGESGSMTDKFYITKDAIKKLNYLHMNLFGKICETVFPDVASIGAYFTKMLLSKKIIRGYRIAGKEVANGNVYSELGFTGFIIPEDIEFKDHAFEVGSSQWNAHVRKATPAPEAAGSDSAMLPPMATDLPFGDTTPTAPKSGLPWD
jgi:hypothetical protein